MYSYVYFKNMANKDIIQEHSFVKYWCSLFTPNKPKDYNVETGNGENS